MGAKVTDNSIIKDKKLFYYGKNMLVLSFEPDPG